MDNIPFHINRTSKETLIKKINAALDIYKNDIIQYIGKSYKMKIPKDCFTNEKDIAGANIISIISETKCKHYHFLWEHPKCFGFTGSGIFGYNAQNYRLKALKWQSLYARKCKETKMLKEELRIYKNRRIYN